MRAFRKWGRLLPALGLGVLFLAAAGRGWAVWVEDQVVPADLAKLDPGMEVKTKQVEGFTQFDVTVSGKESRLLPVLNARVRLFQGETKVAEIPVEESWSGDTVSYWFRVAKPMLANSKFEWGENGGVENRDAKGQVRQNSYGRPEFIGLPGGRGYWFYLRDFAAPAAP